MNYRQKILSIRSDYLHGRITLGTAKALVIPLLGEMNIRGAAIARQHGQRFTKLTFAAVFR